MPDNEFIFQEFYCTSSGGGCGGYVMAQINKNLNGTMEFICPKCKHAHQRSVVDGEIKEDGRFHNKPTQTIHPPMAAWSKKQRTKPVQGKNERDGRIVTAAQDFAKERWAEIHGVTW